MIYSVRLAEIAWCLNIRKTFAREVPLSVAVNSQPAALANLPSPAPAASKPASPAIGRIASSHKVRDCFNNCLSG